jgi:hypothetical protein
VSRPRTIEVTTYADGFGLWHADVLATPDRVARLQEQYDPAEADRRLTAWAKKTAHRRIEIELRQREATRSDPHPTIRFQLEYLGWSNINTLTAEHRILSFKEV